MLFTLIPAFADVIGRIGKGVFVLVFCLSAALAEDERQDKPGTPGEKYQALLKERENA